MFEDFSTYVWFAQRAQDLVEGSWVNAALAALLLLGCRLGGWAGWRTLRCGGWLASSAACASWRFLFPMPAPPPPLGSVAQAILAILDSRKVSYESDILRAGHLEIWPATRTVLVKGRDITDDLPERDREAIHEAAAKLIKLLQWRASCERQAEALHALAHTKEKAA